MNRITGLFAASIVITIISATAYAQEPEAPQPMVAECRMLAQSGKVHLATARSCIIACSAVDTARDSNAKEAAFKKCKIAHAEVTKGNVVSQSEQHRTRARSSEPAAPPKIHEMADIEGVYLQTTRSGFRVRAEGRKDWKTYCNEAARPHNDSKNFARTVKPYDRVRFTGISYQPSRANDPVTRCRAKKAVILGSSQQGTLIEQLYRVEHRL